MLTGGSVGVGWDQLGRDRSEGGPSGYILDVIVAPSIFRLTRKDTVLARMPPTFALNCEDRADRREWNIPR